MIPVTDLRFFADTHQSFRVLKPWWDVFMDYTAMVMMMIAVFGGTLQVTQDKMICLPCKHFQGERCLASRADVLAVSLNISRSVAGSSSSSSSSGSEVAVDGGGGKDLVKVELSKQRRRRGAIRADLDRQQYSYVDAVCYERVLHWFAKYFPYLVLLQTVLLLVCSNLWLRYPRTSSKLEHFVCILGRCFDSPWTTRALSETAVSEEAVADLHRASSLGPAGYGGGGGGGGGSYGGRGSYGSGGGGSVAALRYRASRLSQDSLSASSCSPGFPQSPTSVDPNATDFPCGGGAGGSSLLDRQEGEQARALFEKVKKFRAHVERSESVHAVYLRQSCLRVALMAAVLAYTLWAARTIRFDVDCAVSLQAFTGYRVYRCAHPLATLFRVLCLLYVALLLLYGALCVYTLLWMLRRSLKRYSFEVAREESSFSDIPDVRNDFAFLLHLIDQVDPLYSKRFAVFLSEVSENKLKQMNLNHEWTADKLRLKMGGGGGAGGVGGAPHELHLFMLAGLPDGVFEVTELESLRLELLGDVTLPATLTQLSSLRELSLLGCRAVRVPSPAALAFLRDNLRVMRLRYADQRDVPPWIYSLKALEELYIHAEMSPDCQRGAGGGSGGAGGSGALSLESLRELKALRVLHLRGSMSKLPAAVMDVAGHLQRLSINNEGARLLVLNSLKKVTGLAELELINCDLERIPHAIFSLVNLQDLDLRDNNLRSIEEILSFQHLHKLTTLKLWKNHIASIPEHIKRLGRLERLYLTHNNISVLPSHLFLCNKLRHLDLGHNEIRFVPPEVGVLQSLLFLSLSGNKIESLPEELFFCRKLKTLRLGANALTSLSPKVGALAALQTLELRGNPLEGLPAELGECAALRRPGVIVEQEVYDGLPADVRERLSRPE